MEWPVKLFDADKEELQLMKDIEHLKQNCEKSYIDYEDECKAVVKDSLHKVKKFQNNLLNFERNRFDQISSLSIESIPTNPNELRGTFLNMAAEINILLSENLYICNKELTSLKYQIGHDASS